MNFKITALLGVLLLALAGFLIFYERPRIEAERRAAEAEQILIDISRQTVARLLLANKHGRFAAEKRGNQWVLQEPVETIADWVTMEELVSAARGVEQVQVVVDSAAFVGGQVALADFGLAPPRVEVQFEPRDGEAIGLYFGDDNPAGSATYLTWSGGNQVALTKRVNRRFFEKTLLELRDKRVAHMDYDRVHRVMITSKNQVVEVRRDGLNWQMIQPFPMRAEAAAVNRLLADLRRQSAVDFAAESIDDPAIYGLDDPVYRASFYDAEDVLIETLLLGKTVSDDPNDVVGYRYGRTLGRPHVFVADALVEYYLRVSASPNALRYKQIFEFDRSRVDRLRLFYRNRNIECRKTDAGTWIVSEPSGYRVRDQDVANLIDRIYRLRAEEFVDATRDALGQYGLDHPALVASFWQGDRLLREVSIGQGRHGWYGMAKDMPEVVLLAETVMDNMNLILLPEISEGVGN